MKPLVVCLVTIAVAVPAGWNALDADIQADGPKLRPPEQTLRVGDATIALQLDRGVMPTGGTVSAILTASSDRPHAVTIDLATLEDMGFGDERVANPPLAIDRRKITLHAQPGGGPPVVASIALGHRREGKGETEWFNVIATARGEDLAAQAGVAVWTGNTFSIVIEPPAAIPPEGPFTVAVRIKNTTKHPLDSPSFEVGGRIDGWDSLDRRLMLSDDNYDITPIDDHQEELDSLAVGAEHLVIYRIVPKHPGVTHFTLVAHARAGGGGAMETAVFDRPVVEAVTPAIATK